MPGGKGCGKGRSNRCESDARPALFGLDGRRNFRVFPDGDYLRRGIVDEGDARVFLGLTSNPLTDSATVSVTNLGKGNAVRGQTSASGNSVAAVLGETGTNWKQLA